ncbi:MAG: hypothetical protein ACFFDN_21800 [Candidatus Hodarchaeota archaeon]
MEEIAWKTDTTPYLVFPCSKCKQYTYTKTTRKIKKCARCGRSHTVSKVMEDGEIVNGISVAVELVKKRQNELAVRELGTSPEFRTINDFKILNSVKDKSSKKEFLTKVEEGEDYYSKFKQMLIELSKMYLKFPFYTIEMMAENYNIPNSEVKILANTFQKQGLLIRLDDYLYQVDIK